mgnify:CR=1 FL=1
MSIQTATTRSTSGKSNLTYQIGCTPDSSIYIRITKNSGAGFFKNEWLKIVDIQKALANGPEGQPLTSFLLQPPFQGKSSNSPRFMVAATTNERLLRGLKGKKRGHEFLDPEEFTARMEKLVSAKTTTGGTAKKTAGSITRKAPTKKAIVKKRAVARRKTAKTG